MAQYFVAYMFISSKRPGIYQLRSGKKTFYLEIRSYITVTEEKIYFLVPNYIHSVLRAKQKLMVVLKLK